ncbi:MAG: hypothetical protein ABEJ57_05380 [Halobacteriaceae archaeon]
MNPVTFLQRRLRDILGISTRRQRQATRGMQVALVGFLVVGLVRKDPGIVVNTGVALAVTELPAVLNRDLRISMDPALVLWLTTAVFLHAVGTLGPYQTVWWWDHLTHAVSSSIVAGAGYATTRAVEVHNENIVLPPRFLFAFLVVLVLAFGVGWEVLEFGLAAVATGLGSDAVLTQYGLDDSMLDLVFDAAGGLVVAAWGTAYLSGMVTTLAERMASR